MNLKKFSDDSFDVTLLFGPMYHLHEEKDKLAALREAVRVTRPGGRILVAYIMNEFSVITYAFKEKHILEALQEECSQRIITVLQKPILCIPWFVWKILKHWTGR